MRVNLVDKARKPQGKCRKCGKEIKIGDKYKWIKPRYGARKVCCGLCHFSRSDMTSSKLGAVYDAQDDATKTISEWNGEDVEDLKSVLEDTASVAREVADEYRESAEAMPAKAEEWEEKADNLESYADNLESTDIDAFDDQEGKKKEDWIEDCKQLAQEALDEFDE